MSSPSGVAFSTVKLMQSAFNLIALLQFTAYMWPKHAEVKDGQCSDFIIVGAGTAGCVIANRLTENPDVNVLLIEAGGDPPIESDLTSGMVYLKHSQYDWNMTTEDNHISDQCHQKPFFEMTLGKMLGGSSSLSYAVYARGYPTDFNRWAEIANDDTWTWDNVLPFYKKAEKLEVPEIINSSDKQYFGTDGFMRITKVNGDVSNYLDAFKDMGYDKVLSHNPSTPLGFSSFLVMIADGHRQSTATAYLTPIKHRPNLHVMKHTTATKIIIKDNKATGVEAVTNDGKTLIINANKEVIVSAGVFNSPKLLMLSGVGPKEHLSDLGINVVSDIPVGENLQDHSSTITLNVMKKFDDPKEPNDPHLFPVTSLRGFATAKKDQNYPDYAVNNFIVDDSITLYFCSYMYRFKYEICDALYESMKGKIALFNQIINLDPKSRGKVLLRSSNPADPPIINSGQFTDPEDLENLIDYVQDLSPFINSTYFRSMETEFVHPISTHCEELDAHSREYWHCYAQCVSSSLSHYTSTCPMGAVLDGHLRVHGVKGLRVADASIMPKITRAHPASTVIMIGEKAADLIKEDYKECYQ